MVRSYDPKCSSQFVKKYEDMLTFISNPSKVSINEAGIVIAENNVDLQALEQRLNIDPAYTAYVNNLKPFRATVGGHAFNELFTVTLKDCTIGSRHRLEIDLTHHGRAIFEGGFKIRNFFINARLDYNENVSIVEDRVKRKITNKNKLILVLKIVKRPGGKVIVPTNLILIGTITYCDEVEVKELIKKANTPESPENDSGEEMVNDLPTEEVDDDVVFARTSSTVKSEPFKETVSRRRVIPIAQSKL